MTGNYLTTTDREPLRNGAPTPDRTFDLGVEASRLMGARLGSDAAPIRNRFIAVTPLMEQHGNLTPPLTTIMRSGRGNNVRLKLMLSLLWAGVAEPHEIRDPASRWARILGLHQPQGSRQIRSSFQWLAAHQLIEVEEQAGKGSIVRLLDEGGINTPYHRPSRQMGRDIRKDKDEYYIQLPATIWTKGWIQLLGAPALAMLLVLMHLQESKGTDTEEAREDLWLSLALAKTRYGLTNETRYAGINELVERELLTSRVKVFQTRVQSQQRPRHVHRLHLERLDSDPTH